MGKSSQLKKILFIIPSLEGGGAERVLINILEKFDYTKYVVDVCVGISGGVYFREIPKEVKTKILFNFRILEKALIYFYRRFNSRILLSLIINKKYRGDYDVGIAFTDCPYTDIMLCLKGKIKKKIAWVHASYYSNYNYKKFYKNSYKNRLIKYRYNKLDTIVFVSNDSRLEFQKIFGEFVNTVVIYNILNAQGIKLKALSTIDLTFENDICHIIAVGHLRPVKAFDKLIHVARKLMDDGIKFKIRILGSGHMFNKLLRLIKTLNVGSCVELLGFKSNPYPFIKASDIFIMTSISEALPTALCEAIILGLPCIVTDCSGCREIVEGGKFGMMTGQTINEIYNGLKVLITDHELRNKYKIKALERAMIFDDTRTLKRIYSIL